MLWCFARNLRGMETSPGYPTQFVVGYSSFVCTTLNPTREYTTSFFQWHPNKRSVEGFSRDSGLASRDWSLGFWG